MSYDGSFSCESALKRLLSRCPKLGSDPKLLALSRKGGDVTADDIVGAIADPFLHPDYTIPIVGCFRPLCRRIADRAVAKLGGVPSLESVSEEDSGDIGEDDVHVIDFYVKRGRGLRLHELASLALCRALDLAPFLLRCVLKYFEFSPQPFKRLLLVGFSSQLTEKVQNQLLGAIRVTYRFLVMEPSVFSVLWDWTSFLDLMLHTSHSVIDHARWSLKNALDIRWCSIQILSAALKLSDRATENCGLGSDEAFACLLRFEEICEDTSLEKAGCYLQPVEAEHESCSVGIDNFSQCCEFDYDFQVSSNYFMLESEMTDYPNKVPRIVPGTPFVLTSTIRRSFEMSLMAVGQRWPILLHGPAGSGKTALVNRLAETIGNQVLFIHTDEQMDGKTLIGNYICSDQPGEFRWQPGSLTQAILKGYWVVLEDIDKAPSDVHSIILPLLEGSSTFVTGHGEAINVRESFRLFATISTSKHEVSHEIEGRLSFSTLWRKVLVKAANSGDMIEIVNAWYPRLSPFIPSLVDTYERVCLHASNQVGAVQAGDIGPSGALTRFSLRDLLKWCKRISDLDINISGLGLSVTDCQNIYQEAIDIFAAYLPRSQKRLMLMREIARIWGIPLPEAQHDYPPNKPVIQIGRSNLRVGRIALPFTQIANSQPSRPFVSIRSTLLVLEMVACSVKHNEPVLLVGETGTGKTTLVQNLAMRLGQRLTVLNLSQQSDATDLLGGYKPADAHSICIPLYQEFRELFCRTFSAKENEATLRYYDMCAVEKNWKKLLNACRKTVELVRKRSCKMVTSTTGSKRKRPMSKDVLHEWESFFLRLDAAQKQLGSSAGVSFKFVEGVFVTALRNGHWILLDEVNLAPPETLQRISSVLDSEKGTLCLAERGDIDYIDRHSSFRLFACMNPATDAGKRELPYFLRSRFTEYFVDDVLDDNDLTLFVRQYMDEDDTDGGLSEKIVRFYKAAKRESEERLQDGANQKPQFSLRSLARALEYTRMARKRFSLHEALYDGFCMFFLTLLDGPSAKIMHDMIVSYILEKTKPKNNSFDEYIKDRSSCQDVPELAGIMDNYILTKSVKQNLKNLARAVYIKKFPVLLQGPTSSGKTSLVHFLASVTGHEFVRINNHEHTDLQEYFGTYITDSKGKLQFQEGALVKAVRHGYWIVLDELNLAPSDVLEALNRLLDDNRELFIPELQETIPAHPNFMLFATQNPPTFYGGRKMLSRAFRNRFLEIHVDEIPEDELTMILERRCKIPGSYASKMVEVMKELQLHRQRSKVFAGKHGFITPRDLFRWANRFRMFGSSYEDLAKDGYLLLADRLRDENEKYVVRETLERHLRVKLSTGDLYMVDGKLAISPEFSGHPRDKENFGTITWTNSMHRLFFLVERCYRLREPVLLVGETGGGKTTVCQLLSVFLKAKLHILNCHQYTETSDFIGGFYPVRDRSQLAEQFKQLIEQIKASRFFIFISRDELSSDITQASLTIEILNELVNLYRQKSNFYAAITLQDLDFFEQLRRDLIQLHQKWQTIFLWQDGPLVQAMKDGDHFLVDEISLADDSVLERLNSVLEPERKLSLAEKGGAVLEHITAHPNFFILATMNPGGDYGKKELSPALRNRFTEIWVPPVSDMNELRSIAVERFIKSDLSCYANYMLNFWEWFNKLQIGRTLTVRDMLSWVSFVNVAEGNLGPTYAFIHGIFLVLLDGLSLGTNISKHDAKKLREQSLSFLVQELKVVDSTLVNLQFAKLENYGWGDDIKQDGILTCNCIDSKQQFGIKPFYICKGSIVCKNKGFEFLAPTTSRNVLRVLRAMQLSKPVLLEGSPGVGKTSLVVALAEYSGHNVVRINLSEQTDMMDLLGSDLPTQKDSGMEFSWCDGILLKALKTGSWVLLDELNLAPQSVLEGLNAILDHRAEVFIPELGLTFRCPPSFRIFACQNPSYQGGGRKGLPKSFLNRFTKVYVDELDANDYLFICRSQYPSIPETLLSKLICFNNRLFEDTMIHRKYGQEGSPWEFNLRDVMRSCQIIEETSKEVYMDRFLNIVYLQRMRTVADRREVLKLYEEVFGLKPSLYEFPNVHVNPNYLIIGSACVERNHFQASKVLKSQLNILPGLLHNLEVALHCVQQQWLCILVGPYSSGKTSLIRLLANLTGNMLHELNLSPGTDVTDLLGCFEQYNLFRHYRDVITQIEHYVDEYFSLRLEQDWNALVNERKNLFSKWFEFLALKNRNSYSSTLSFPQTWEHELGSSLNLLTETIKQLQHDKEKYCLGVSWSNIDLEKLQAIVTHIQKNKTLKPSVNFEWVSGVLIKAIENGEWVVLENANLCNPTVLDRINSLFEPNGSIIINECGLSDGKPLVLNAHPKFRMFLTVDPKNGEVSRAMRNRGVEIFLMEPSWLPNEEENVDINRNDVKRFLVLSGIPCSKLVSAMTEAHLYVRSAGLHLGVRITLRELSRWVQLFQQLLMKGNQPKWSLQLSWEHTYLSSFGESEGMDAVMQAKLTYLSDANWYSFNELSGYSLHVPKGWPTPLTLQHLVWYSKETCLRENCSYLEFLASQCASFEFQISSHKMFAIHGRQKIQTPVLPINLLHHVLFPDTCLQQHERTGTNLEQFDLVLANKMLFFSANWSIEQAMESDFASYILLFQWYKLRVQPYCNFLGSFLNILDQEKNHTILKHIHNCWRKVISYHKIDIKARPLPMLSSEVMMLASDLMLEDCQKCLCNATNCVKLLRLTYQQWSTENDLSFDERNLQSLVVPVLKSLRCLEAEALELIVESQHLQQIYAELIEHHMLFWKSITSSNHDLLSVTWGFLRKEVMKLQNYFPKTVKFILDGILNINNIPIWIFRVEKPTLWLYGGHPFLPPSADIFYKMQQLLTFCDAVWPRTKLLKQNFTDNQLIMKSVVSSDLDLRQLALQALCMSSYAARKDDQGGVNIVAHIDELYQGLSGRFEHDMRNLELVFGSTSRTNAAAMSWSTTACCSFCLKDLCRQSGFESWLLTLPLFDVMSFSFDIELLNELSKNILVDSSELQGVLHKSSDRLTHFLNYSLKFSSRPPMDFTSHQMILWILDAWKTVDSVHVELAGFLMDMWLKFHTSLWSHCSKPNLISNGAIDASSHIVLSSRTVIIDRILRTSFSIKDYDVHCLKLRLTSRSLWQATLLQGELFSLLHSAADVLFKQIIYVHHKSFAEDVSNKIKSILCSAFGRDTTLEDIETLKSLISSSNYAGLSSHVDLLIKPLLRELYIKHPSCDYLYNLGCAWLHMGMLRFHLLNQDGPDPALKYSFKHSNMLHKISLLELETKVRRECERLSGRGSLIYGENQRLLTLQKLKLEEKQLRSKVVFRPERSKYWDLRSACANFGKLLLSCLELVENLSYRENILLNVNRACNWQATSSSFIKQLSEEYAEYIDLIQPVQVAIYEMKLGLSLAVSSALERDYLEKLDGEDIHKILAEVYSFMQFPRSFLNGHKPIRVNNNEPDFIGKDVYASVNSNVWNIGLLKKLVINSSETSPEEAISHVQLEYTIHYAVLIQTADHVSCCGTMDEQSFLLLNGTFEHFSKLWMGMKSQLKAKEDDEAQYFKFRPRLTRVEDIMAEDNSSLDAMDSDESLISESCKIEQEFCEMKRPVEEDENVEEKWDLIPETILKSLVQVHDRLFGKFGLVEKPGIYYLAKEDRLRSFLESYKLGARIMKDLDAFRSTLDDKLMPEHLFRVCLECEGLLDIAFPSSHAYNIYKDPNPSVLYKMVKPLTFIQARVKSFLDEWPDHPGLQNLCDIIDKLLSAELSTPLSKALLSLQHLVGKAELLQEHASMFSLTDLLHPIYSLISSWQKLELDCWSSLLDEVEEQYHINAGKLWFPLYAILHRKGSGDAEADTLFTIQSIKEFIESSNVGEFKKRLDLLLAFHGQLRRGVFVKAYSSFAMQENMNILYNAFGYYVQFLPIVQEHIETSRKSIEKDLKDHLKLFNWEHAHNYSSIENFSRIRQKTRKLIQKFNDALQQPSMLLLNQEAISRREKIPAWLENCTCNEANIDVLQFPLDVMKLSIAERFLWCNGWREKAILLLKTEFLQARGLSEFSQPLMCQVPYNDLKKLWEDGWSALQRICTNASQFAHIWKHGTKNLRKRRALINLLKVLEESGLSRHKSISNELEAKSGYMSSLCAHPSFDVLHLLLQDFFHKSDKQGDNICESEWKSANQFYFRNLAVMHQLREICLSFNKDLTLEQVNQAISFLNQLISMQQEQRVVIYNLSEHLKKVKDIFHRLNGNEGSVNFMIARNQPILLLCMWEQKQLFDSLLALSRDTCILLGSIKRSHFDDCKDIRDEAESIDSIIDLFIPRFLKSKESLDAYLIGGDGIVVAATTVPSLISKQMENLVMSNFEIICEFEDAVGALVVQKDFVRSVVGTLRNRFEELINKVKIKDLMSQLHETNQFVYCNNAMDLELYYTETYERTLELMTNVYLKLCAFCEDHLSIHKLSAENITLWKHLFQSYVKDLCLDGIDDALRTTIIAASKLVNSAVNSKNEICCRIEMDLKHLRDLLDLIITFGDGVLSEFLDVHAALAEMTNVLAHIFMLVFSKGFGSTQEETESTKCNGSENATGTGMGEGEGINDVSDQIEDESQLFGSSEKDLQDKTENLGNENAKGIEMEEDFDAETFSVSEDSDDNDLDDEEDPDLDSKMGQTTDGDQVVDEKQWDKDEDGNTENLTEKYESGPSVKETDSTSRELRAKDDNALSMEDPENMDDNDQDRLNEDDKESEKAEDEFKSDDMMLDKSEAFEESTGIQFQEQAQESEDMDINEPQGMEEEDAGSIGSDEEMMGDDDMSKETDAVEDDMNKPTDAVDDENSNQVNEDSQNKAGEETAEIANMELQPNNKNLEADKMESIENPLDRKEPTKSTSFSHRIDSTMESEMSWANSNDMNSGIAPSRSLPSDEVPKMEISMPNSVDGSRISYDQFQSKPENSQDNSSSMQSTRANPYRSLGDAMEDWKERAKVSVDLQEHQTELIDDMAGENADEFGFISDAEKSTSQALADATADQINNNFDGSKSTTDENHGRMIEDNDQAEVKENSNTSYLNSRQELAPQQKVDDVLDMAVENDELTVEPEQHNIRNLYADMISFKSSYMDEKGLPFDASADDELLSMSMGREEVSEEVLRKSVLDWKRYEVLTTQLSQELAEQLRLVMEPTLASKLQGDYRTGKRINMKKVIPYIASHFRKDKIWLRRTKPNKRNYQVVVAIDDSRSMSESQCGSAAIEALVTVCRAMSQLEIGQFAVASFGKKGNVKLLHDFDQPFTGEAGVKIISSLSFKQDNAIADEPLVDLLKYLNGMLDSAVSKARTPSGQNPLNQFILIIADGRIHEKENLKRRIRDMLNKKRLIALILLDNPQESIMDLMEASYQGEKLSFTKYLNNFPFPYYIILKNMEMLPRTLADMLRQPTWTNSIASLSLSPAVPPLHPIRGLSFGNLRCVLVTSPSSPTGELLLSVNNLGHALQEVGSVAEELKEALLRTTLELESTRATAQEELRRMESQALHLTRLLEAATRERDEARHALLLLLLHHADRRHTPPAGRSPSVAEGSDVAAPAVAEDADESSDEASLALSEFEAAATARRGLPEKGRLVEAVMGAGPLLQTLLLAGPLPQWRHPPPDLRSSDIPPVAITMSCSNPKREKDGHGPPSPSPTSLWNSSSSSSSLESGNNKFRHVTTFSLNSM
ncbi:midasin isoform X3 [Canna indica]|uniref:Midasin n=1 Tax=Canna indica TaxID=4628 RepID=A0AAQ3QB35_9LILI|nr:midasin isoform X3 [Canna indica]